MKPQVFCFISLLFILFTVEGSLLPRNRRLSRHKRQSYQITNFDIHRSIKILEKSVGLLQNKLTRHEFREAQAADSMAKTLNVLQAGQAVSTKAAQSVSRQLIKMEEKMLALEALVVTTDERQRHMLSEMTNGLNRLLSKPPPLPELPPMPSYSSPDDVANDLKKLLVRFARLQEGMEKDFRNINNEVKIVGESMVQHMEQMKERHDILWKDWNTCNSDHIRDITKVAAELTETRNMFSFEVSKANKALQQSGGENCNNLPNELVDRLNSLDKAYQDQEREFAASRDDTKQALDEQKETVMTLLKETRTERDSSANSFGNILENLEGMKTMSKGEFSKLEIALNDAVQENAKSLKSGVDSVASVLKVQTSNIRNILDDSVDQADNLQERITEEFNELSKEIRSLKKVEQVMLSTADAVLDTKRSIEFGIQQVIIELSDIVKNSGQNINTTLSDQINNISFAILKNQTSALTNMTARMEQEISQVWRQIGIMYQQIQQSADILGVLQATTAQQMNASLGKVDNMDTTVGDINGKVADVEDNLNYLLGRLSLVVSEFSQMKTGVGAELDRLRDMAEEFSAGDIVEYKVNRRKRNSHSRENF